MRKKEIWQEGSTFVKATPLVIGLILITVAISLRVYWVTDPSLLEKYLLITAIGLGSGLVVASFAEVRRVNSRGIYHGNLEEKSRFTLEGAVIALVFMIIAVFNF